MKTETIKNILTFLKEKEGHELPKAWIDLIKKLKLIQELENHPDGTQYKHRGSLDLRDSTIRKLPNDLHVTGALDLRGCQYLTELPDNLYVAFYLRLWDCVKITKLPNDLYVGGNLALIHTNISEIPNNLYVGVDLFIRGTPLSNKYSNYEIREMITSKGGTLIGKIFR